MKISNTMICALLSALGLTTLVCCGPVPDTSPPQARSGDGTAPTAGGTDGARVDAGQIPLGPDGALLDSTSSDPGLPPAQPDSGMPQQTNGCPHFRCPLGTACIAGSCGADNCVVQGCPGGAVCVLDTGICEVVSGECDDDAGCDSPIMPIACEADVQCAAGSWCVRGRCFIAHCVLAGCPGDATCDTASGLCLGAAACSRTDAGFATCQHDVECAIEQFCVGGTCRPVACAAGVCPADATCISETGRCRQVMYECTCGMCGTPHESGG